MNGRAYAKIALRSALHRAGVDLVRHLDPADLRRQRFRLIEARGITLLLDVGASAGQYAQTMRGLGYRRRIVSFEPLSEVYTALSRSASQDPLWDSEQIALGPHDGDILLNVSANSQSSSVLGMLDAHLKGAPDSHYVREERVPMTTLSAMIRRHASPDDRIMVKLDAQGYEVPLLEGADEDLERVRLLQVEMSLVPLYEGQELVEEVMAWLRRRGFAPVFLEPTFSDPATGAILQVDGLFARPAPNG